MLKKIKYDKADKYIFQDVLPSGLRLVIAPMSGNDRAVAGVYSNVGGLPRSFSLGNQKIYPGTVNLMTECLVRFHPAASDPMFADGKNVMPHVEESYSSIAVDCPNQEVDKMIEPLLALYDDFGATNDQAESLKAGYVASLASAETDADRLRPLLYASSPMRGSFRGTAETIKNIHQIAIRKFFNEFIVPENMTLFVVGDVSPQMIRESAAAHVFPARKEYGPLNVEEYKENYNSLSNGASCTKAKPGTLSIGIKFPARKDLFERYGEKVFAYYELLNLVLFTKLNRKSASLLKYVRELGPGGIRQGGEDAFLFQSFITEDPLMLRQEAEKLFAVRPLIGFMDFRAAKKHFLNMMRDIYKTDPEKYYLRLLSAYANAYAEPALCEEACRASYFRFRKFIAELAYFPRAYLG